MVDYRTLKDEVWHNESIEDASVKRVIERLQQKLNEMEPAYFAVETKTNELNERSARLKAI